MQPVPTWAPDAPVPGEITLHAKGNSKSLGRTAWAVRPAEREHTQAHGHESSTSVPSGARCRKAMHFTRLDTQPETLHTARKV